MMTIDKLIQKTKQMQAPICVGLDTMHTYLPAAEFITQKWMDFKVLSHAIYEFNKAIIDEICEIVPSVKVQVAYYEMYGYYGMQAFRNTLRYARKKGMITIADVKRNDIGSTAQAYSKAYLSGIDVAGQEWMGFDADFITVNGYLGSDGILPFVEDIKKTGKGIFVLVKTSNPSSSELQNLMTTEGKMIYQHMADQVEKWGEDVMGENGYSAVGAVVGPRPKKQQISGCHKNTFFLIPGYGAQGAGAEDIAVNFDKNGLGGGQLLQRYSAGLPQGSSQKLDFARAAKKATEDMRDDIRKTFPKPGYPVLNGHRPVRALKRSKIQRGKREILYKNSNLLYFYTNICDIMRRRKQRHMPWDI